MTGGVAGGFVGVGAGVAVVSVKKNTQAFVGESNTVDAAAIAGGPGSGLSGVSNGSRPKGKTYDTVITESGFHGLAVQARSSEDFFGMVIAIGAGFVGVAIPVGVTLLSATTAAFIAGGSLVNTLLAGGALQSVEVAALDSFKSLTVAGGAAGGFVGVGAGVDIGVADTSTSAYIGGGAEVRAARDVNVYALASKQVATYAISIGGGFVGVAGSASIWTVGTAPTTKYNATGPDQGAWSASATYKGGDVVTASDLRQPPGVTSVAEKSPDSENKLGREQNPPTLQANRKSSVSL